MIMGTTGAHQVENPCQTPIDAEGSCPDVCPSQSTISTLLMINENCPKSHPSALIRQRSVVQVHLGPLGDTPIEEECLVPDLRPSMGGEGRPEHPSTASCSGKLIGPPPGDRRGVTAAPIGVLSGICLLIRSWRTPPLSASSRAPPKRGVGGRPERGTPPLDPAEKGSVVTLARDREAKVAVRWAAQDAIRTWYWWA